MFKSQRSLWVMAVIFSILVLFSLDAGMASPPGQPLERYGQIPDFQGMAVTSISQKPIQKADLLGRPWVVNFIFSSCGEACPVQIRQMVRLQKDLDRNFRFISFTVDPETDQPVVLQKFARTSGADPRRWLFVRMDRDNLVQLLSGLKLGEAETLSQSSASQLIHSSKCILIDGKGDVRGSYECMEDEFLEPLRRDTQKLLNEYAR